MNRRFIFLNQPFVFFFRRFIFTKRRFANFGKEKTSCKGANKHLQKGCQSLRILFAR